MPEWEGQLTVSTRSEIPSQFDTPRDLDRWLQAGIDPPVHCLSTSGRLSGAPERWLEGMFPEPRRGSLCEFVNTSRRFAPITHLQSGRHLSTFSRRLTWPSQMEVAHYHEPGVRVMSVTVTIHFPVSDVPKAIEGLRSNAKFLEEITESTRGAGMLRHRFVSGDGELVVIDEWETAEQFQSFFDGNPKVAEVMASVGMTGPPEISVFGSIDAPGTV